MMIILKSPPLKKLNSKRKNTSREKYRFKKKKIKYIYIYIIRVSENDILILDNIKYEMYLTSFYGR